MIEFNGTDQAIDLVSGGTINCLNDVAAATMIGWFRFDTQTNGNCIAFSINNGDVDTNTVRMELDRTGGGIQVTRGRAGDGAALLAVTDPGAALTNGTEYNMAATVHVGNDNGKVYRNGALIISGAMAFTPPRFDATASASAAIMANPNASSVAAVNGASDGSADDCRIYQKELPLEQIETIYACRGHDGIWFEIHHRWKLDEESPGTVAAGAGSCKDDAIQLINVTPRGSPTYGETRLSTRRRYL